MPQPPQPITLPAAPFLERCRQECTRDVIFLFQHRSAGTLSNTRTWHTDAVFLSREEATQWGRDTDYNYPGRWRVYGVPANGALVEVIKHT